MSQQATSGRGSGRPLGFEPDAALNLALKAFWTHGYAGTTTAVLEEATQLSRSSLLNTFGTKDKLLLSVLRRYQEMVNQALCSPLAQAGAGLGAIEAFFSALAELKGTNPGAGGCLIVNLASEQPQPSAEVQDCINRYRDGLAAAFGSALKRAVALGEIDGAGVEGRRDTLVGLAIAVNWTARAAGTGAAQQLARAACAMVHQWADDRRP